MVEAKDDVLPPLTSPPAFDSAMFDALDAEILSVFS